MPTMKDDEFGTITIRRSAKATNISLRVAPDGTLRASLPLYAPLFLVKRLLKSSRQEIRSLIEKAKPTTTYTDGMSVGKSHTVIVRHTTESAAGVTTHGQHIVVTLPSGITLDDPRVSEMIHAAILKALRREAKSYLPKRLAWLAAQQGLEYQKVRFSHASSRWGSCSSTGTISLNIALMKLPFELIDYVIMHELAHTVYMNHGTEFWELVSRSDPSYKQHRTALKNETPSI